MASAGPQNIVRIIRGRRSATGPRRPMLDLSMAAEKLLNGLAGYVARTPEFMPVWTYVTSTTDDGGFWRR